MNIDIFQIDLISCNNIKVKLLDEQNKELEYPLEIDSIVLYENSQFDEWNIS